MEKDKKSKASSKKSKVMSVLKRGPVVLRPLLLQLNVWAKTMEHVMSYATKREIFPLSFVINFWQFKKDEMRHLKAGLFQLNCLKIYNHTHALEER